MLSVYMSVEGTPQPKCYTQGACWDGMTERRDLRETVHIFTQGKKEA